MKDLKKSDLEKIVKDEIKKFIKDELDGYISDFLSKSNSKSKKVTNDLIKQGLSKLAEFLYIRRNVWQADIK